MAEWASALVGRGEELAALERALAEVERGGVRAVGLWGEPGIGKSRLLLELAGRARERGLLVLGGRAAELERDLPFGLLVDALEPLVREERHAEAMAELGPGRLRELAAVLPGVEALADVEAALPSGERHRAARAVRALLERLAARRPLAVLFDDVQWADPASADVLALLLHRPPRGRVLLALAARGGRAPWLESALAAAEQHGTAEVLELGPLPLEVVGELLPGAGRVARERLYRESGGNPFYLQELARARRVEPGGSATAGLVGVPRAVQAALARELAALRGGPRRVLEGAAVVGDPFEVELAAVAAGADETGTLAALDELLAADLVRPTGRPRRFGFRHPLVRRAVYEGAGGGWRLAAHARAAEALAARGATPARRAHHVERAARLGDLVAVDLLVAAAVEVAHPAPATAAGWLGAAARLLPDGNEHDERRLALLRGRAQMLVSAGRAAEARDVLHGALDLMGPDAVVERAQVAGALAELDLWIGAPEEAREAHRLLRAARAALVGRAPTEYAALTLELSGERKFWGDFGAAARLAEEARSAAQAAGGAALEAEAVVRAADAATRSLRGTDPSALAAADRRLDEAAALVEALPDERLSERLEALMWLSFARLFSGRHVAAGGDAERGLLLARRTRQGLLVPAFLCLRGYAAEESGQLDVAEEAAEEALESVLVSSNATVEYWASLLAAWVALARGRIGEALARAELARSRTESTPPSSAGWTLADARLAAGEPGAALAVLEAFGWVDPRLPRRDRLRALDVVVRTHLAAGHLEEAAAWAGRAGEESAGQRTGTFAAMTAHIEASVLLAQRDAPQAASIALAGARAADHAQAPLWVGRCRRLAGQALAACGRTGEARSELRRAASELEACGAWGYRDAALRALRRLGDRPRPAAPGGATREDRLAALSPREREVARLVADGQTNAQIAAQLHLSERTVEKHVSRVLGKLGLSSRTGVVRLLGGENASAAAALRAPAH